MLSHPDYAKNNPFEWQKAANIVYCDYLEHLFLHILICECPSETVNMFEAVGIGGIINFIVPELNDLYSGWKTKENWRHRCHSAVQNDEEVYLLLLKRFVTNCSNYPLYSDDCLFSSFNETYGLWNRSKNKYIFDKISKLI